MPAGMEFDYTRSDGVRIKGSRLEELKSLTDLTELSIRNLEIVNAPGAIGPEVLPSLSKLSLPECLERLRIEGYDVRSFLSRMMPSSLGTSLPELRSLALINCQNALQLLPLGRLPELRNLEIVDASGAIGPEFFGDGVITLVSFPKLETLELSHMRSLQQLSEDDGRRLRQKLEVRDCPALKTLPRWLLQWPLMEVKIVNVGVREVDNFTDRTDYMLIRCCSRLERISDHQELTKLCIWDCFNLKRISNLQALRELTVRQEDKSDELPQWLLEFLKLQQPDDFQLVLRCGTKNLQRKCLRPRGQYWPTLEHVPNVRVTTTDYPNQIVCMYYTKEPFDYWSLESLFTGGSG